MEEIEPTTPPTMMITSARAGATGSEETSDKQVGLHPSLSPQNHKAPDDLPMIVWLKGDEAFLDEFCLDAEGAMKALGIKRSRLTQISGKELRVGRLRIDRYTRPVYRIEDIENYKSWTRATASHLRASTAIEEAAQRLEEKSVGLAEQLQTVIDAYNNKLEALVANLRTEITEQNQNHLSEAKIHAEEMRLLFIEQSTRSQNELRMKCDSLSGDIGNLKMELQGIQQGVKQFDNLLESALTGEKSLQVVAECLQQFSDDSKQHAQNQAQMGKDIGKALTLVIQFMRDMIKKQDEIQGQTKQLAHQTKSYFEEESLEVCTKPKVRIPFALRRRMAKKMY